MSLAPEHSLYERVVQLLEEARAAVVRRVNHGMVLAYFEIGRMIVEEEQAGQARANYGQFLMKELSSTLSQKFGKGFSVRNLEQMRQFYLVYSKAQTTSAEFTLSWSHYLKLMRMTDPAERNFYEIEARQNNWSLTELQRQYDAALYTRLALSRNTDQIRQLAQQGQIIGTPRDVIKDPYILEFLGLPEQAAYSESELETALINKLEHFLLELGKGFTFVARQHRITFDEKHFRVDLVFYNRLLRAFVLIDLKIGELKHQDLGQMQMYVNYYDRFMRVEGENKTVGIILCRDKNDMLVEITLPEDNTQIFASQYLTVLPSKEDLKALLQRP
ncbi:MAG: DUF1016 domain-containing protein [Bacteroidetes bacterium]|nr:MAG: DUF1016 domain-containing protein [Bacteroidota bacterium]